MTGIDVIGLTAERAMGLLRAGECTAEELAQAYLDRIAVVDPEVHAYLDVDPERTLAAARAQDAAGGDALSGVPIAYKDLLSTKDVPTTAGSRILEGFIPIQDADVVARGNEAGLVSLGKTNLDEFAMGSSTEHSAYGPTHNPWDLTRVPGGSSGGSAAVVAAGCAPWSLGTDTGGSIRQPAAFCGLVGLMPTYGTVSRFGVIAFACSLEQVGPMTLTVRDAALLHQVIAADSPNDATCTGPRDAIELPTAGRFDGLRFGVPWAELEEGVEPGIRARFDESLAIAKNLGAEIVDVELPYSRHGLAAYYVIAPAEASANLSRFDGVRYGLRVDGPDIRSMYEATRDAGFGPEVKRRIMIGTYALSAGYHDAYYVQAQRVRTLIRQDFDNAFAGVDAILLPTAPTTAFPIGARLDDPLAMYANDIFTLPVNLAGIPALSLPNGLSEGLPSSLQLIGPAHSENLLLRLGAAFEAEHAFDPVPPSMRSGA
ncbi:MAG: Asp-tRNA(Asn)/Glu-tRNA(Gln) amidotransferase subunit GatA [Gaiellales bacterium]|nr:Asp-tRNA(Asn)/Glu-tRNA(Gln) amidotransferase subunit GatA [Gaiellales bacterium]